MTSAGARAGGVGVDRAVGDGGVDADDVGVAAGQREHALQAAADEDRRAGLLDRLGQAVHGR